MESIKRLVKTENDRVIAGVCGGLARYFGIDTAIVRIGFVASAIFGVGSPVIIYAIMALILPNDAGMDDNF